MSSSSWNEYLWKMMGSWSKTAKTRRRRGQTGGQGVDEGGEKGQRLLGSKQKRRKNQTAKSLLLPETNDAETTTLKRMNCSPATQKDGQNGRRVVQGSCYTNAVLMQIRDAYNKNHGADKQITETQPILVWKKLRDRLMGKCAKEDCWLNEIKDETLRKRLDRFVFAPDKPREWKKKPNAWLSNFDILGVLEQYEAAYPSFEFLGPSPIDFDVRLAKENNRCVERDLCSFSLKHWMDKGKTQIGVVFNLDKHNQPGSHWVSLFIDVPSKSIFYFDSAGACIPAAIKRLVDRIMKQVPGYKFRQNCPHTHQHTNTECGVYSLFFIVTMLTRQVAPTEGEPRQPLENMSLTDTWDLFKKQHITDKYVERYRNIYFND